MTDTLHIFEEDTFTIVEAMERCKESNGVLSAVFLDPEDATEIKMIAWNPLEEGWVQYLNNPLYAPAWPSMRGLYPEAILGRWAVLSTKEAKEFTLSQHQAFMVPSESAEVPNPS